MKYRLKQGLEPRAFTCGRTTYILNSTDFREYPDGVISVFGKWLDTEEQETETTPEQTLLNELKDESKNNEVNNG